MQQALGARYAIERELGRGGTARVFLARDQLGRTVALKMLHPDLLTSVAAERFLREIRIISTLQHPGIARLLDSGEEGWIVYFTMEYIEGPSLREAIDRDGPLSVGAARRLADEVLRALEHAHARGIVHRDVKPENIVLAPGGAVLLDFGIARAVETSSNDRLTRSGTTIGTSAYMSPEQVRGLHELDQRSDLYSFGCVLFECLAGRPPFTHRSDAVVLQLQLTEPAPDLTALRPDMPPGVAHAVARALAKSCDERWQGAAEMRRALMAADAG